MTTLAEKVVSVATAELGVTEVPAGSNTGPRVRQYQSATSLGGTGWPWCAAFVEWVWKQAGVDTALCSPATAEMCRRAGEAGRFGDPAVGGAIIWCGTHVGLVVAIGNGIVHTIEGNSGDGVNRRVRSTAGARFINPVGLDAAPPKPTTYWLEDLGARPRLAGPWGTVAKREAALAKLRPETRAKASRVRTGAGKYGIRIGPRKQHGPYQSAADRDRDRTRLERRLGRTLRPYREGPAPVGGKADDLGKTT